MWRSGTTSFGLGVVLWAMFACRSTPPREVAARPAPEESAETAVEPATAEPVPSPARAPVPTLPPTESAVSSALADAGAIEWTTAAALIGSGSLSCIDGRSSDPVLGAPGGDAGEMILALASLERSAGRPIELSRIPAFLDSWFQSFGRVYLHTDEHALERLREAVLSDPRFAHFTTNLVTLEETAGLVRHPPVDLEHALLEHLLDPANIGCGHLRLLLSHPREYGTRPELARAVLEAAYRQGWRHPERLAYTVLTGAHRERAIVRVLFEHDVEAHARVAMLVPHGALGEVFVVHPQVIDFLRRETAGYLVEHARVLGLPTANRSRVVNAMRTLGARQIAETREALAPGLPVLEVRFTHEGMTVRPVEPGA